MRDYFHHRDEINRLLNAPKYRRLKYSALIVIAVAIAAQIATIIWLDVIPSRTILFIRGCVGVAAIVFVVLVAILAYKVYSEYFTGQSKNTHSH